MRTKAQTQRPRSSVVCAICDTSKGRLIAYTHTLRWLGISKGDHAHARCIKIAQADKIVSDRLDK